MLANLTLKTWNLWECIWTATMWAWNVDEFVCSGGHFCVFSWALESLRARVEVGGGVRGCVAAWRVVLGCRGPWLHCRSW
jgi:hypothetical protein